MFNSVQNYCEKLVYEQIQVTLAEGKEGSNADFLEDVACIALNRLPPKYVRESVDTGFFMSAAERDALEATVYEAVCTAIEQVRQQPDGPHRMERD